MDRRKIRDEADARRSLAAVARAGVGIGEWARANGIDGRSLRAWRMNLDRGDITRRRPRVRPAALVELVPAGTGTTAKYVLRRGDVMFEFGDDAREETLRRLVAVLRAC
jgi:hypothetical protein